MAPRPRGGWQVGNRLFRQQQATKDQRDESSSDFYTVAHDGPKYIIRHFPNASTRRPCCVVAITPRTGAPAIDALAAAARHCDAKHREEAQLQPQPRSTNG